MEYSYQAKNMEGKFVRGTRKAACENEVAAWLKELSLAPLDIRPQRRLVSGFKALPGKLRSPSLIFDIPFSEKVLFFRGFAFLLSSGVALSEVLAILIEQTPCARVKRVLAAVLGKIDAGLSFSGAITDFPELFDPLSVAFVRSGEASGRLAENMSALAALLEGKERLRKKIVSAMIYPAIVMLVALSSLIIMSAVVLPRFEGAFAALNVPMPPLTAFVFRAGRGAAAFRYSLPALSAAFLISVLVFRRYAPARLILDGAAFRLPLFGKMLRNAALSRSFAAMACLMDTGVPLPAALDMAGEVAANARARQSFARVREGALAGMALNVMMRGSRVFPPAAVHMVRIGEETGRTGAMFRKLAESCEADLEEGVKRLTSMLEPLVVILVGALVSFIALAVFMPVVAAIESLT